MLGVYFGELTDLTDGQEIAERVTWLFCKLPEVAEARAPLLRAALEVAPRVSEDFALALLDQTVQVYDALPRGKELDQLWQKALLLEKAMFVAAHYDRIERFRPLVERLQRLLVEWKLGALAAETFAADRPEVSAGRDLARGDPFERIDSGPRP